MLAFALYLSSFLHLLSTTTFAAAAPSYTPTDYFLLNCGTSSNETSSDNRIWDADALSKFSPANIATNSTAATASKSHPSLPSQVPYITARIFQTQFTYTFPVLSGQKFVRFYFYPATYNDLDMTKSFFSVTVNNHTLLQNFSAFLTVSAIKPKQASLIKEFVVNVRDTQRLEITFSPSLNSYAFVNGIEVVSMPENLYIGKTDKQFQYVSFDNFYYIDNYTAIETLYRLNVGGNAIPIANDTGMFRIWDNDESYILGVNIGFTPYRDVPIHYSSKTPAYIAPEVVYTTSRTMGYDSLLYKLTWSFSVDSGFHYLVRLHFCEIQLEVTLTNQRVFFILLNNQTAEQEADVINWSGGTGNPVFRDYVVWVPQMGDCQIKQNMWLMMYPNPNTRAQYRDALLNGLEMFKLNGSDGSLSGPNPELIVDPTSPTLNPKSPSAKSTSQSSLLLGVGGVIGGVFVIAILGFMVFRQRRRMVKELDDLSKTKSSWVPLFDASSSTKTIASSQPSFALGDQIRYVQL